jgi:O-antigen ligase
MTTPAIVLDRRRPELGLWLCAGSTALVLGAASAWNVRLAAAFAVGFALAVVCAFRTATILAVMIASVFVEVVSLGGITVTRLVAPVALVALIAALTRGKAAIRFGAPLGWALAYSLWALASGLWTVSLGLTVYTLSSLAIALVYTLAFAGLLSSRAELERVLGYVAVAALGIGLFGLTAYARGSLSTVEGRASGGAGDPNFFAAYQVVAIPLVLVLAGQPRRRWLRVGLYATVLVLIASVLTTLSRGGLIALVVIAVLTLVLPWRTIFRSRVQKTAVVLVVLAAAGLGFQTVSGTLTPRLDAVFAEGGGSGRLILWQGAWTSIKERPVTGLGYGSFSAASDDLIFRTPGASVRAYDLHVQGEHAHNAYIGTAAELGIPGLMLFLGLLVSTALALRRTAARARARDASFVARVANALTISLVGWAIASIFLTTETSRPLWIVVGIALALPKFVANDPRDRR